MIINKNINNYAFNKKLSVKEALKKIEETNLKTLFIVDNIGHLEGVIVDGDIRRWLLTSDDCNLDQPIENIINITVNLSSVLNRVLIFSSKK